MLIARKQFSLGPFIVKDGDVITDEMKAHLPAGRVPQLVAHGWCEEVAEQLELLRMVQDLEARVARLEALSDREPPRRGRPPKIQEFE